MGGADLGAGGVELLTEWRSSSRARPWLLVTMSPSLTAGGAGAGVEGHGVGRVLGGEGSDGAGLIGRFVGDARRPARPIWPADRARGGIGEILKIRFLTPNIQGTFRRSDAGTGPTSSDHPGPVVGQTGGRHPGTAPGGQSTLAREIAATRKRGPVTYLDLESDADLRRLAEPSYALEPLRGLVILDEVQRRPELFPSLRVLADRPKRPARFLVLGSASPHLLKQTSETLAGRIAFYELPGLSLEGVPVAAPRPRVRARRPRRPVVTSASAPSREVSSGKHADTRTPFP